MRARLSLVLLLLLPLFHLPKPLSAQPAPDDAAGFDVQRLASGVYAVIRREAAGLWFEANNLVVIGDDGVLVVDANFTPSASRAVIAAVRRLTDRPVRYVVNTHWHDDHISGNQAYRDAFPGVAFVGHTTSAEDMAGVGETNRRASREGAPGLAARLRDAVAKNQSLAGGALAEDERAGYLATITLADRYAAEAPSIEIIPPTVTVADRTTLRLGRRTVEVLHLGAAHTRADLVVRLPREGIVAVGDLVSWPVPLVGSTSYPVAYGATLDRLLALRPRVLVPGHGPVMRDLAYARTVRRLLGSIEAQTRAAIARGESLEQARRGVDLASFRLEIAGESRFHGFLFDNYVTGSAIPAAYREMNGSPES